MALRSIRKYGDPVLRKIASPVTRFNSQLSRLLDDMIETMLEAEGIGLAAPQVGISKRIIVVKDDTKIIELINPEIIFAEGEIIELEGCLSLPGLYGEVARQATVGVKGQNREGNSIQIIGEEILSRALQHEIDHLDGILFIDRAIKLLSQDEIREMKS